MCDQSSSTIMCMCVWPIKLQMREVKTFSTKTSRDVGMVPSVSKEHMCLHGKINWRKNFRNKEGYHSMLNNPG